MREIEMITESAEETKKIAANLSSRATHYMAGIK